MLGRPYCGGMSTPRIETPAHQLPSTPAATTVRGTVQSGDQRGRLLGFPTINLSVSSSIAEGVYAGLVHIEFDEGARSFVTAVSVGRRETYYKESGELLLEAHVLDFAEDVYGRQVRVELHRLLRGQRSFSGTDALVRRLRRDVASVRSWARNEGHGGLLGPDVPVEPRAGRWNPNRRRTPRDREQMVREREARRFALIRQAVVAAESPEQVDHHYVAEWTGLSVHYVEWQHPTLESLRALGTTPSGSRRD